MLPSLLAGPRSGRYLMTDLIRERIRASVAVKTALLSDENLLKTVEKVTRAIADSYRGQGKVFWCGNGGSAADAQHLAAELSGRFYFDRPPLYSEALHTNTSYLTAVANDYGYEHVYSRLVEAGGRQGDVLIGMSTSGNSGNVVRALESGRKRGMITVGLTGENGGKMQPFCDHIILIPSKDTPRIQECHMLLGHTICELVESELFGKRT
jgi:D-sedoheptulose 7-phosphate isomerase